MQHYTKVLTRRQRPTKNGCRSAIAQTIRNIKAGHRLTNDELADRVGCTGATIGNAENERNTLDLVTLANIQYEFGADAIDPFQALSNARGVPEGATYSTDLNPIVKLAEAIGKLAEVQRDDSEDGPETSPREAADLAVVLRSARAVLDHEIARITPIGLRAVS